MHSIAKKALVAVALTASLAGVGAGVGTGVAEARPTEGARCQKFFDAHYHYLTLASINYDAGDIPRGDMWAKRADEELDRAVWAGCL